MPTPTYDLIASNVLGSSASSVTFSSIPGTYRDLVIVVNAQSDTGSTTTTMSITLNGDTTNVNYSYVFMQGNGSTTYAERGGNRLVAIAPDDGLSLSIIQIFDYNQSKHKTYLSRTNNANNRTIALAGRWADTSTITSLTLFPGTGSFRAGGTFYLYGIVS